MTDFDLDKAVADMRKVLPTVVAEIERRAIEAATPATEGLREALNEILSNPDLPEQMDHDGWSCANAGERCDGEHLYLDAVRRTLATTPATKGLRAVANAASFLDPVNESVRIVRDMAIEALAAAPAPAGLDVERRWLEAFVWGISKRIVDFDSEATVKWLVDDLLAVLHGSPDEVTQEEYARLAAARGTDD